MSWEKPCSPRAMTAQPNPRLSRLIFVFPFPFHSLLFYLSRLTTCGGAGGERTLLELVIETAYRPPSLGRNGAGRDDRRGEMAGDPQHYRTIPQPLTLLSTLRTN